MPGIVDITWLTSELLKIHDLRTMKYILLLGALFIFSCKQSQNSSSDSAEVNASKEFKDLALVDFMKAYTAEPSGAAMLIDLRTPPEYNDGTINGAVMINYLDDNINQQLEALDKSKKYYIFCAQGGRSKKCMDKMQSMGFSRVYNLLGGYEGYKKK